MISLLIIPSIQLIHWVVLLIFIQEDILPQLFIAPRELYTVLIFCVMPNHVKMAGLEFGILTLCHHCDQLGHDLGHDQG